MPLLHVSGVGIQEGARLEEPVVKLQVQVMCLKVHEEEDGGHCAREFPESVEDILGLKGCTLPELLAVDRGCRADRPRVLPRAGGSGMERTAGAELRKARPRLRIQIRCAGIKSRPMPDSQDFNALRLLDSSVVDDIGRANNASNRECCIGCEMGTDVWRRA